MIRVISLMVRLWVLRQVSDTGCACFGCQPTDCAHLIESEEEKRRRRRRKRRRRKEEGEEKKEKKNTSIALMSPVLYCFSRYSRRPTPESPPASALRSIPAELAAPPIADAWRYAAALPAIERKEEKEGSKRSDTNMSQQ